MNPKWYHVCWPRLTAKRVEPVVSISWASCKYRQTEVGKLTCHIHTLFGNGQRVAVSGGWQRYTDLMPLSCEVLVTYIHTHKHNTAMNFMSIIIVIINIIITELNSPTINYLRQSFRGWRLIMHCSCLLQGNTVSPKLSHFYFCNIFDLCYLILTFSHRYNQKWSARISGIKSGVVLIFC